MNGYEYERTLLASLANEAGESPALTQGAGGNVSIKISDGRMLIKSSGCRLREVTPEKGISLVDLGPLRKILNGPEPDADSLSAAIKKSMLELNGTKEKPSVETGFHAMLGSAVVHQHSVYANFIACCADGKIFAEKLFPEAVFVPFAAPGPELCLAIKKAAGMPRRGSGMMFFQNHGLAVFAEAPDKAMEISRKANKKIKDFFCLPDFNPDSVFAEHELHGGAAAEIFAREGLPCGKILTLDQQLYCCAPSAAENITEDLKEIIGVVIWLLDAYRGHSLKPSFIQ